ncbi:MAG TPA: hypothetical protein DCG38_10320 [Eubacteriaceae bacterium]|nr:hypothetical protein [Eubacteriaceae bacterium]
MNSESKNNINYFATLFVILTLLIFISCKEKESVNDINKVENNENELSGVEIIEDNTFELGFALTPLDPETVQQGGGHEKTSLDTLSFDRNGNSPIWRLAQWYSKYNLANAELKTEIDGSLSYANEGNSKRVALYPDNSLLLEVNASKEYDKPRSEGEPWPHLLIEQDFHENSPIVGEKKRIQFSFELKLEKEQNKMEEGTFNPSLHTAQSPCYFIIKNINENSQDYNQQIWFGIASYDYRYTETNTKERISWDIGTNTYIYQIPERQFWGNISFQDKKWHKGEADLKPLIQRAIIAMQEKSVFMNTTLDDLSITYMNFGWEVPGTFDVAVRVKNFSLKVFD